MNGRTGVGLVVSGWRGAYDRDIEARDSVRSNAPTGTSVASITDRPYGALHESAPAPLPSHPCRVPDAVRAPLRRHRGRPFRAEKSRGGASVRALVSGIALAHDRSAGSRAGGSRALSARSNETAEAPRRLAPRRGITSTNEGGTRWLTESRSLQHDDSSILHPGEIGLETRTGGVPCN